jgi:predicted NBD/HSP70 family sugar kinase
VNLRAEVAARTDLPVALIKDTAAACVAELVAGRGRSVQSFLYVFVDTFIGGGLVLDSHLRAGLHGNAGAIGSLPMGLAASGDGTAPAQLLSVASLANLEARYRQHGLDAAAVADDRALQAPWLAHTQAWLADAAGAVALAVNSAACLLDLESVIVDGSFSRALHSAGGGAAAGAGPLQLGGRDPAHAAARHHRVGRAGAGRRPAAAACQLLARPRPVPEARAEVPGGLQPC